MKHIYRSGQLAGFLGFEPEIGGSQKETPKPPGSARNRISSALSSQSLLRMVAGPAVVPTYQKPKGVHSPNQTILSDEASRELNDTVNYAVQL